MIHSVATVLGDKFKKELDAWDKWDYEIWGPHSLDDLAFVEVVLINRDDTKRSLTLRCDK